MAIPDLAEIVKSFEIFGALLIFVVHFDLFIRAIQAVSFICWMIATGGLCVPNTCPQGFKKMEK